MNWTRCSGNNHRNRYQLCTRVQTLITSVTWRWLCVHSWPGGQIWLHAGVNIARWRDAKCDTTAVALALIRLHFFSTTSQSLVSCVWSVSNPLHNPDQRITADCWAAHWHLCNLCACVHHYYQTAAESVSGIRVSISSESGLVRRTGSRLTDVTPHHIIAISDYHLWLPRILLHQTLRNVIQIQIYYCRSSYSAANFDLLKSLHASSKNTANCFSTLDKTVVMMRWKN